MCFYHSVAIKIEIDDLLEVGLNQIVNIFSWENVSKTPLCKSLCKKVNQTVLACEKTDVLLIACKNKGNKAHGS